MPFQSCQNSFQYGLASEQLIRSDEHAAELDGLRAKLRSEQQPANTTEEILVDELAQHFWRMRRFRELEARAWGSDEIAQYITCGYLALVARNLASAERSFFRTLAALSKLQKARGFIPQKQPASIPASQHTESIDDNIDAFASQPCPHDPERGFVPQYLPSFEWLTTESAPEATEMPPRSTRSSGVCRSSTS